MQFPILGISLRRVGRRPRGHRGSAGAAPGAQGTYPVVFGDGPMLERFPLFRKYARATPAMFGRATGPTLGVVTELAEKDRIPASPPAREAARSRCT